MDRNLIQKTLNNFENIYESGIELFEILDYPLKNNTFSKNEYDLEEFLNVIGIKNTSLTEEEKRYIEKISLLFAFSEGNEEKDNFIRYESDQKIIAGYIFLSVKLKDQEYSKTKIVNISKKINRLLNSPAFIIFNYDEKITLTITDRRIHKRDHDKDVIEKTTLIKDIDLKEPHAAHVRILEDINFKDMDANSKDFNDFHKKWKEKLSVRELNKGFYKELYNWFFSSIDKVKFPSPDETKNADKITADPEKVRENNTQNLIRFLTRIIFVWFLKEKGIIDKKIFDEKYIYENVLVKDTEVNNSTYYKAILQNLFFATLNTEMNRDKKDNRKFISSFQNKSSYYGVHNKYRYLRFVKDKNPNLIIDLFDDIPFLNGGLFECLDEVGNNRHHEKRIDMFSDNPKNEKKLIFPDELLFSNENKKEKNSVKGLFNILNKYKFTLEENTPVEEDVALDPELLGRIFENLLASYNPETRDTARKATGSYYTPREIVHYMVDSSIKEYLKTNLDFITEDKLGELFDYNKYEHKFEKKQVEEIVKAIYDIKILDPACGSGAFPMGVLNRLVFLLEKLDPENYIWKEIKMEEIKKEQEDFEERHNELNYIFNLNKNDANYARKLFLIENSIYGVDIQPIAAQISKLRFFISLIIEQKVNKEDKNFGLLTLPNLETKFVTANTLLKIEKPKTLQLGQNEYKKIEEELKSIRNKYFEAKTKSTKDKYKMLDKEKREQLKAALDKIGFNSEISQKIAAWNPYEHNNIAEFFDSEFMFGIKDGFDVVIGNPPYIRGEKIKPVSLKEKYKKYYETFNGTSDIYIAFYEKGYEELKQKGFLSYITSNKWTRANYGKDFREFILKNVDIKSYIDFNGIKVFENATVDTSVFEFQKSKKSDEFIYCDIRDNYDLEKSLDEYIKEEKVIYKKEDLSKDTFSFLNKEELKIKKRIEKIGTPLKDWDIEIYFGIKTGYNNAFIINGKTKDELIKKDPKNSEIIKPLLRGRDIKRYSFDFNDKWLINSHNGYNGVSRIDVEKDYPVIKEWLDQFEDRIKKRCDQGDTPYNLRNCTYVKEFEKEKIVWQRVTKKPTFCLVRDVAIILDSMAFITTKNGVSYLLLVLNSKLIYFYIDKITHQYSDKGFLLSNQFVERIPILMDKDINSKFYYFLSEILVFLKGLLNDSEQKANELSDFFEKIADFMVYGLYFKEEVVKDGSYINEEVEKLIVPINEKSKEEKIKKIEEVYNKMKSNPTIQKALTDCQVKEIKIIESSINN
ncbi:MAG: adenine-specific DNA-methyltransferase [Oceanotoga sp.]|uniref:Eco57I restriction-modification methylase domain-containing protein n=1 Tax=Oceanotoga sp. TaxID=2108366 RepID=UPI00264CB265|nr:Eco57I restriction-modification methylase domain-containing protein [Oceanotoga sp.]MDN5343838.1 adenine-specific DNA-methyltransferase [Oceanotoga sp.]